MHLSVRALRISGCVLGHSRVVTRVARASRLAGRSSDCSQDRTSLTCARSMASMAPTPTACAPAWTALATTSTDLTLRFTLPTGQSFRWWQTGISEYTGVLGSRVVRPDANCVWLTPCRALVATSSLNSRACRFRCVKMGTTCAGASSAEATG